MALAAGDRERGERVFREHPAVTCTKCHKLGGEGGSEAGPDLDGVASRLSAEDLLRAVVDPNAALAEGFQNWLIKMTDDEVFVGRIVAEAADAVQLETNQRERFDLPLAIRGTPFQEQVWRALLEIPYGATWSYRDVATRIGLPGATRAVGTANGMNRIAIVIPCHRVVNADGKLGGYGGGVWRKQFLLDLERGQRRLDSREGVPGPAALSAPAGR
jgi:O-6-methylguanine DNA methyltransferase